MIVSFFEYAFIIVTFGSAYNNERMRSVNTIEYNDGMHLYVCKYCKNLMHEMGLMVMRYDEVEKEKRKSEKKERKKAGSGRAEREEKE